MPIICCVVICIKLLPISMFLRFILVIPYVLFFFYRPTFHCMDVPHFEYPLTADGRLDCSYLLTVMNNAMNIPGKCILRVTLGTSWRSSG